MAKSNESPILERCGNDWLDGVDYWICHRHLAKLFEIGNHRRICLRSYKTRDRNRYRVELSSQITIDMPVSAIVYQDLHEWLSTQIEEGRPYIGVMIVEDGQ